MHKKIFAFGILVLLLFAPLLLSIFGHAASLASISSLNKTHSIRATGTWSMFRGDARHTGLCNYDTSSNKGSLLWKYPIGKPASGGIVKTSPVLDGNDNIYVGVGMYMYSVSSDGKLRWKYAVRGDIESSAAIGSDGSIYFGSKDGFLYALSSDGKLKWKFNATTWVTSSPVIDDSGTIYFGSNDYYFYALHLDGTLKWKFYAGDAIASSPAIGNGNVYFATDFTREIFALYINNGTMRWKDSIGFYFSSRGPAVGSNGNVYICDSEDMVHAWSEDGSNAKTLGVGGDVAIGRDGTLYAGTNKFYAINQDGSYKWTFTIPTNPNGINMDNVPAIGSDGTIYFGTSTGELYALNTDGSMRWKSTLNSEIAVGPVIGKDGHIYAITDDGVLYAVGGSSGSGGAGDNSEHESTNGAFGSLLSSPETQMIAVAAIVIVSIAVVAAVLLHKSH